MSKVKINGKRRKMKTKIVIGIAIVMLLFVIVAFSGCIEDETTKSTENGILPSKKALQPGVYDVSELSNLPMTINLGNDTYLVLTDADKETISGYFENKGRFLYPTYFDLEVIFRDKNGKVVNNGVREIRVKYEALKSEEREYDMRYLRKIPVYVGIPLDFFETWEVRGESIIYPYITILEVGRSQDVKLTQKGEYFVELTGTIDVTHSGKGNLTATFVGEIESKSDKKLTVQITFTSRNVSKSWWKPSAQYLYLEPFERRTFEAQFSTPDYETDNLLELCLEAREFYEVDAKYQDRII